MVFSARQQKPERKLAQENLILKVEILKIYQEIARTYGAPKIHQMLLRNDEIDFQISEKRMNKIMNRLGIQSETVRKYRP